MAVAHGSFDGARVAAPDHNVVIRIQTGHARHVVLLMLIVVGNRRRVEFDLVLASEKTLAAWSASMRHRLITFLETSGQRSGALTTHVDLNLVQALAHAAGLAASHLVQRELLALSNHSSFTAELLI